MTWPCKCMRGITYAFMDFIPQLIIKSLRREGRMYLSYKILHNFLRTESLVFIYTKNWWSRQQWCALQGQNHTESDTTSSDNLMKHRKFPNWITSDHSYGRILFISILLNLLPIPSRGESRSLRPAVTRSLMRSQEHTLRNYCRQKSPKSRSMAAFSPQILDGQSISVNFMIDFDAFD